LQTGFFFYLRFPVKENLPFHRTSFSLPEKACYAPYLTEKKVSGFSSSVNQERTTAIRRIFLSVPSMCAFYAGVGGDILGCAGSLDFPVC
jgi:hypothetical protein